MLNYSVAELRYFIFITNIIHKKEKYMIKIIYLCIRLAAPQQFK